MSDEEGLADRTSPRPRWVRMFADAADGMRLGLMNEPNLRVHFGVATATVLFGAIIGLEAWRWSLIAICITIVITAEYLNSAIEQLVRAVADRRTVEFANTLHLAAAAVLVAAIGATLVGLITLLPPTISWLLPS